MTTTVRQVPRMTFSALCEYLSASPVRQLSLLRAQKFPRGGAIRSYRNALHQIGEFAVHGVPLDPQAEKLEPHEQEIIMRLLEYDWRPPAPQAAFPATRREPLVLQGVEISVYPDLLLADPTGPARQTGAMKFYFRKSQKLDPNVGRWMASFLFQYKLQVEGDEDVDPDLCLVYDVRNDEYFEAGKSHKRLFNNVESACQFISAMWDSL